MGFWAWLRSLVLPLELVLVIVLSSTGPTNGARGRLLLPVILATWEAENKGIEVQGQHGQIV
jgi:hypothetical protein